MQCPQCGQALPEDVRFCIKCGTPLAGAPAYVPPRREGIPGWAIALIVGCGGLFLLFVVAVVAAIVLPRALGARQRANEANARSTLEELRLAVREFQSDCGSYPKALTDLTARSAPKTGLVWTGTATAERAINPTDWKGPYLDNLAEGTVPVNKLTGGSAEGTDWIYNPPGEPLGTVIIGAVMGLDSHGTPFTEW